MTRRLDDYERRLAAVEAESDDPFFADMVDSHEAVVALLEARDRVVLQGADQERLDARLRAVLDRTLPANALRRAAAPERASWWWTYRAACDEELVAREASGRSTEDDRERLAEHLASCDECRRDLAGITRADRILDGGAGALEVACPSVDELRRFVRGELAPALGRALDVHVTLCDRCRSALRARSD